MFNKDALIVSNNGMKIKTLTDFIHTTIPISDQYSIKIDPTKSKNVHLTDIFNKPIDTSLIDSIKESY